MRATVPIAAYTAWRFRNRKLVPYSMAEDTELADSTITRPIPVSRNAAASITTTVRGMGWRRSRRRRRLAVRAARHARTRSRSDGRSSSLTTRRVGFAALRPATTHPLSLPVPVPVGPAVAGLDDAARQGPGRRCEPVPPLRVVAEHVLAGARGGQQHGASRGGHVERGPGGLLDGDRPPNRDPPVEHLHHLGRGLTDRHHARQRRDPGSERREVHPL